MCNLLYALYAPAKRFQLNHVSLWTALSFQQNISLPWSTRMKTWNGRTRWRRRVTLLCPQPTQTLYRVCLEVGLWPFLHGVLIFPPVGLYFYTKLCSWTVWKLNCWDLKEKFGPFDIKQLLVGQWAVDRSVWTRSKYHSKCNEPLAKKTWPHVLTWWFMMSFSCHSLNVSPFFKPFTVIPRLSRTRVCAECPELCGSCDWTLMDIHHSEVWKKYFGFRNKENKHRLIWQLMSQLFYD